MPPSPPSQCARAAALLRAAGQVRPRGGRPGLGSTAASRRLNGHQVRGLSRAVRAPCLLLTGAVLAPYALRAFAPYVLLRAPTGSVLLPRTCYIRALCFWSVRAPCLLHRLLHTSDPPRILQLPPPRSPFTRTSRAVSSRRRSRGLATTQGVSARTGAASPSE